MTNPTKQQIIQTRKDAGLTQTQAAELIGAKLRTWQDWEGEQRNMPAAKFELFELKVKNISPSTA
jgi:DNA-binding XRE family transcriptional regulator